MDNEFTSYGRVSPKYVMALSSTAHTYGNLLATAQQWVLGIFKQGLFKTIHVNSRIAHSQILRTPSKYIKKERPMIIFSPRIEYGEDLFMDHTLITEKRGGLHTTGTNGVVDLNPFFYDGMNAVSMQFTLARRCMMLDVLLSFDTMMEQLNYMDFLLNELDWNRPFDINTWLEAYLAPDLLNMLGDIVGVPVHAADGSTTEFLNYINGHSVYPVTHKLAGSTGREEFYRYYHTNIIATLSNLDKNTGDSVNHVTTNYTITFTLRLEFWSPGLLYLMSDKVKDISTIVPSDSTLIPIYADVFVLEDLDLAPGWQVYGHASYILEKENDSVSYESLVQETIRKLIAYYLSHGKPLLEFLDVKVRRMGDLLEEGRDYTVDYLNSTIRFKNDDWGFDTYTVIVSINAAYVNQLLKEIFKLE